MHKAQTRLGAIAAVVAGLALAPTAAQAWDPWPCEVALCLANPSGPLAVSQCVPPIKRAWKAWARGKIVPACMGLDADGTEREVTATRVINTAADPMQCPPQFVYFARKDRKKFCAMTGVTDQYIDGQLWGRIWYGGPNGEHWIEVLREVPGAPRVDNNIEAIWKPIQDGIQAASIEAARQWEVAKKAELAAITADEKYRQTLAWANQVRDAVDALEASLPAQRIAADAEQQAAIADWEIKSAAAEAAKAKASAPGASEADKAAYFTAQAAVDAAWDRYLRATAEVSRLNDLAASLASQREAVARLFAQADQLQIEAVAARNQATAEWEALDVLERAAAPLVEYGD